jgi:integrase
MNNDVIEAWLDTYRAAGKAESTIRTRRSYLATMARTVDPLTATDYELTAYLASRRELSPEGRKSMVVALRSFLRWAKRRGLIDVDLASELPSIHVPVGVPKPVPVSILVRARVIASPETLLILDLGALAGLRRAEIAAVHGDDVTDLGLIVKGKGGRVRLIPLHPRLRTRLRALTGWAFPSPIRAGEHVSPDYVSSRVEAVLASPHTTHSLRHYFATAAYASSHDIRAVQQLLGHASVETTMRYVAVDNDSLTSAVLGVA